MIINSRVASEKKAINLDVIKNLELKYLPLSIYTIDNIEISNNRV